MEVKSFIRKIVLGLILFFVISYLIITKTKAKQMGERGLQILVIILILTTILTLVGLNLSRSHIPRLRKIDVQPGKKGESGRRGDMGNPANPLAECNDDMCFRKIMDHITNVVNLWNKVRGLPIIPQGTFIKNKYLQGKVLELCESPQLKEIFKKNGAHKISSRGDKLTDDMCIMNENCGAYDYIFQKWTEWILIILKYRNGREFINSPLLTENEFNNMIHQEDFEKQDDQKDTNGKPLWLFPTKSSLGGNTMGMVLNPTNEQAKDIETAFKQSNFYKYYSKNGVPSAHLVTAPNPENLTKEIEKMDAEELRLKQIDSPFEEIKRYDAWYWGADETSLPKLINECTIEETPVSQYAGQIKIKLTNNYTHLWNNNRERQIKCRTNNNGDPILNNDTTSSVNNHYFHKFKLGNESIDIYRPNDYVDETEDNLFFKNYKPVGYVCFKSGPSDNNKKTNFNDLLPLGKRYEVVNQNINISKTGPKKITILVSGDVKPPLRFDQIVSLERTEGFEKGKKKFTIWRPIAPPGYVALSDIIDVGADSVYPDLHSIVCIPKKLNNVDIINNYSGKLNKTFDSEFTKLFENIYTDNAECDLTNISFTDEKENFSIYQIKGENNSNIENEIISDIKFSEENELNKPLLKVKRMQLKKLKDDLINDEDNETLKKQIKTLEQEIDVLIKKIYDYTPTTKDITTIDEINDEQDKNKIKFLPFLRPNHFFRATTTGDSNSVKGLFKEIKPEALVPNTINVEPIKIVKKEKNPIRYSILNIYNL